MCEMGKLQIIKIKLLVPFHALPRLKLGPDPDPGSGSGQGLWKVIEIGQNIRLTRPTAHPDQGTMTTATNPTDHQQVKDIDIHCHFIQNYLQNNHIVIDYIPTTSKTLDMFSKAPPPILH